MKKSLSQEAYEELADSYASAIVTKPHNAYYDRPAVTVITPDVENKKVLDAGCGPGIYAEWLIDKGAIVTGIDSSLKMLEHARKRNGDKATFIHANMEEPLEFENNYFDGILSPLAIAYVEDHDVLFKEFNRILAKDGWFVFSTEHPFFSYKYFDLDNYFQTKKITWNWEGFGTPVSMPSYFHNLGSITAALTDNGFVIDHLSEPKPTEEFKKSDLKNYEELMRFPVFICIRARKERNA